MSESIIIVDDEKPVRDVISRYLAKRGYSTSVAATSHDLFDLLETSPCDLVILDVELGDENGLEVLQRIKTSYPTLPVIILTGRGFEESLLQTARENGADGYLSKTLPITDLFLGIKRILRRFSSAAAEEQAA